MEYRIEKEIDANGREVFWIEQKLKRGWRYVDGTGRFSAGEAWETFAKQIAIEEQNVFASQSVVTPEEIAMLLSFTPENHGGALPHDADGSYWQTGSDLA